MAVDLDAIRALAAVKIPPYATAENYGCTSLTWGVILELADELEAIRAELVWLRSVVTLHQQNGCGVDLARIGEATGGDRPPYPTLEIEQLRAAVALHHQAYDVPPGVPVPCSQCVWAWPCPTVTTAEGGDHV